MLPVTSISDAATKLRTLLLDEIDEITQAKYIKIGHPKETFEDMEKGNVKDKDHLNLFFYNIQYSGYPSDGVSDDPFYVRLYCLITAVGTKKGNPSYGEKDMRLIGEVMRVLHENPVLSVDKGDDVELARLHIIPHELDLDNLNHIWSTQGDTAYRPSVAYEMSLAPIPLAAAAQGSTIVGDPNIISRGMVDPPNEPEEGSMISLKPGVELTEIDTSIENWAPHICFVEEVDASTKALHYIFNVEGSLTADLDILIAGKEDAKVKLVWNVWRRKNDNSVEAWKENIEDEVNPKEKELKDPPGSTEPFHANRIDPDDIDTRRIFNAKLPDDVTESDTKTWQAVLYAVHEWEHEEPAGSGNMVTTKLKSNPVLFYGEG